MIDQPHLSRALLPAMAVTVAAVVLSVSAGEDWNHLRGPRYDARAEAVPGGLTLGDAAPRLVWSKLIGQGYSGFAVVAGRAYTQVQTPAGQYLISLDVETGRELWRTRYEPSWDANGSWPGPYASPTYSDGRVCFAGCFGTVGCLDAIDGELLWQVDAKERFAGRGTDFGYAASPLIEGGLLIVPVGGADKSVVAFDVSDGTIRWASGSDVAGYTPSFAITVEGRRQVISSLEDVVVAHDPRTGRELWRHPLGETYNPHPAWLLFETPFLFVPEAFRRGSTVLRLSGSGGTTRADPVWQTEVISNDVFSSVIVDGFVYGFDIHDVQTSMKGSTKGEFKCVELSSGTEQWSTSEIGAASVITDGKHLILFTEDGSLVLADATPAGYRELSRTVVFAEQVSWTPPAIYGDLIFVRGGNRAACLSLGRAGDGLPAGVPDRSPGDDSFERLAGAWLLGHYDTSFRLPVWSDMLLWFVANLIGVLVIPWLVAWPIRESRPVWRGLLVFQAVAFGAILFPVLTELLDRSVFTWPAVLFALFGVVVVLGVRAEEAGERRAVRQARWATLGFGLICVGYYFVCARVNLIAGRGFLFGFVPAWPLARAAFTALHRHENLRRASVLGLFAFAVYFWTSVMLYFWRAGWP